MDTSISTVNGDFGLLVAYDAPRCVNGLLVRVVHRGRPLVAGSLDGSTVLMRNNMLIPACHVINDPTLVKLSNYLSSRYSI